MIDITVKVPEDRVPEFYSMFGKWLSTPPVPDMQEPSSDERHAPWTKEDDELAALVWDKFSETAKSLFSVLIDNPEKRFSGDELAELLSISNGKHGVAGVLAWPGRHCFAFGRTWPWSWDYPAEGAPAVYWFTEDVAALFRKARDK
jgi:hypothetical protein